MRRRRSHRQPPPRPSPAPPRRTPRRLPQPLRLILPSRPHRHTQPPRSGHHTNTSAPQPPEVGEPHQNSRRLRHRRGRPDRNRRNRHTSPRQPLPQHLLHPRRHRRTLRPRQRHRRNPQLISNTPRRTRPRNSSHTSDTTTPDVTTQALKLHHVTTALEPENHQKYGRQIVVDPFRFSRLRDMCVFIVAHFLCVVNTRGCTISSPARPPSPSPAQPGPPSQALALAPAQAQLRLSSGSGSGLSSGLRA